MNWASRRARAREARCFATLVGVLGVAGGFNAGSRTVLVWFLVGVLASRCT